MRERSSPFGLVLLLTMWCQAITTSAAGAAAWKKPIESAEGEWIQEELVAFPLDAVVYSRTSDNFVDLRVLDAAGSEVPWRILKLTENAERTTQKIWSARDISLKPSADGLDIRFLLDRDEPQPTSLRIETPLNDFEQRVRVFGLRDEQEILLVDEVIFDYSRYMDVRRVDIPLGENSFRSFRILVDQLTSEQESQVLNLTQNIQGERERSRQERLSVNRRPFRIDRIGLIRQDTLIEVESIVEQNWEVAIKSIREDEDNRRTVVEISTLRQPLTKLRLVTASRNFGRRVHLEVPVKSGTQIDWKRIVSGTISCLKYREIEEQSVDLSFPETRSATYRLIVENRDSPPLTIDGLEAFGHVHQMLFLAQPEETYKLQYGQVTEFEEVPEYDTVAIDRFLTEGVTALNAQLGQESEDDRAPAVNLTIPHLVNSPIFLGGLIVIMTVLLSWGLYGAVKRMNVQDELNQE